MSFMSWLRGSRYPEVERRRGERRLSACTTCGETPTKDEQDEDQREREEMRQRLSHIQRELDIVRRTTS